MKRIVAIVALCAFAAFSGTVKHELLSSSNTSGLDSLPVGKKLADFTLPDRAGNEVSLASTTSRRSLVMINFWGTWCGPCRIEMPSFEKMYADSAYTGLEILAVDEEDSRAALDTYLTKKPLSFPILIDSGGALAKRFGVRAFPTTVLVDQDGKVDRVIEGVEPYLNAEIKQMLVLGRQKK